MMEKGDGGRLETSSVRLMWLLQGACVTKEPGWMLPCMPLSAAQVDQQSARLGLEGGGGGVWRGEGRGLGG